MSQGSLSIVYYYVPEDKDDPDFLNAFGITKGIDEISYEDVQKNFPLKGNYEFRFKTRVHKNIVWLDVTNRSAKLPMIDSKLIVKANRIHSGLSQQQATKTQEKPQMKSENDPSKPAFFPKEIPNPKEPQLLLEKPKPVQEINLLDHDHHTAPSQTGPSTQQNGSKGISYLDLVELI